MIPKLEEYKKRWGIESDPSIKPGLDSMEKALSKLGDPQKGLAIIHIAGTNGKGSTAAFLHAILKEHGLKTASFTSPWVTDVHDQIKLDGRAISPAELDHAFEKMKIAGLSGMLTDFELLTVSAFLSFQAFMPEIVLLECGMGGRFDSTNVIIPKISIITSIGLEHTKFLGDSLAKIAWHKGGIIKSEVPVVTGRLPLEASKVIEELASEMNSPLYRYGQEFTVSRQNEGEMYRFADICLEDLERQLEGNHQASNMAIAITATILFMKDRFSISNTNSGIRKAVNPGRFEKVAERVYLDGAHNVDSAKALTDLVREKFANTRVHFIIGMLKDKDIEGFLQELSAVAASFTFVDFTHERAASASELYERSAFSPKSVINKNKVTLDLLSSKEGVTIITGSLYLLTEVREIIHGNLGNYQNS